VSDSSTVLKDIKFSAFNSSPHPSLIFQICDTISLLKGHNFVLKWFPGHCKNSYIDKSDQLAKASAFLATTTDINFTRDEATYVVKEWIWDSWMKEWESEPVTTYQKMFQIKRKYKKFQLSRKAERIINRFRLLQTRLNAGLFKIGLHADGICTTCGTTQDCFHFIMECIDTEKLRNDIKIHYSSEKLWTYPNLLSDPGVMDILTKYVLENKIAI